MPGTVLDASKKIDLGIYLESPHVVVFRLWFKKPGETAGTIFLNGTDSDSTVNTSHTAEIGPFPIGTEILYFFLFTGNPNTAYKAEIKITQNVTIMHNIPIHGISDSNGVSTIQEKVALS